MQHWAKLITGVLLALVLHLFVFFGLPRLLKPKGAPPPSGGGGAPILLDIAAQDDPPPPPPPPDKPDKPDPIDEKPERVTSPQEDETEKQAAEAPQETPPERPPEQPAVTEGTPAEVAKRDDTVSVEANVTEAAVVAEREPQPEAKEEQAEPESIQKVVEKLSKEAKDVVETAMTETDYKLFLRELDIGKTRGKPTPHLIFAYQDVGEILKIQQYYRMKLVALDQKKWRTVVEVTGLGTDTGSESYDFQKIENFNWKAYSNRVTPRTAPFFAGIRKRIMDRKLITTGPVQLVSITPNGADSYFSYKQLEVLRRNRIKPDSVKSVVGRFHRTSFGAWILAVEKVQMKDGSVRTVQDFELEKLRGT